MQTDNLKEKVIAGDIRTAAEIVGITTANGYKALKRPNSKHYTSMVKALQVIIANRERLIQKGVQ